MRVLMRRRLVTGALLLVGMIASLAYGQYRTRVWARYEAEMQDPVEDPPDAYRKGEFALGRLRYRSPLDRRFGGYARWGIDANKGDRLFIGLLTRLTRVDTQPVETIIDVGDDNIFNLPWLVAISVGDWRISPTEAARLREYFDRGGFLFVDDFHNEREWANFMAGIHAIYPTAEARELTDDEPAFHVLYDLTNRIRVPGANVVHGSGIERGGITPHWRGIFDDRDRMRIAISFNQDVGDAWEFADAPFYPERLSSEGIRIGVNYAIYGMTH